MGTTTTLTPDHFVSDVDDETSIAGDIANPASEIGAALRAAFVPRDVLRASRHLIQPTPAPAVMSGPPAIGASATSTAIASPVHVLWNDPRIVFSGGVLTGRNGNSFGVNTSNKAASHQNQAARYEVMFEGQKFSVATGGTGPTGGFRLLINGQYVSTTVTAATENDGAIHYRDVDLGSRQIVRLTVEIAATSFRGFTIEPTANVWAPTPRRTRALFLGDSITEGTGASQALNAWPVPCASRLGWGEPWLDGQGGSGYLASGSSGGSNFLDRMTYDYQYRPDVIVIWGGINDRPVNNAAWTSGVLQAAVTALLTDIAANALTGINSGVKPLVYVLGCWQPSGSPSADITAANAAILAGVTAASTGAVFIDTTGWVTGTGRVGATTGSGVADFAISSDALHPTDEGHQLIAARAAGGIVASLPAVTG